MHGLVDVLCEHSGRETVHRVVGPLHDLVHSLELEDRHHWPEYLRQNDVRSVTQRRDQLLEAQRVAHVSKKNTERRACDEERLRRDTEECVDNGYTRETEERTTENKVER